MTDQGHLSAQDLRVIRAIADHGTQTGAAEALAIHPSVVCRRLRAVEAILGVSLFDRSGYALSCHGGRTYAPTTAGVFVADCARRIITQVDTMTAGARRIATQTEAVQSC